jgi:Predicted periplasmic or secreted lipoprotein
MKRIWMIPALCLLCFGCNNDHHKEHKKHHSEESSADWKITIKAKSIIMTDGHISFRARFVSVATRQGVVTLSGTVSSKEDVHRLIKIVKDIQGVEKVDDQMTISHD